MSKAEDAAVRVLAEFGNTHFPVPVERIAKQRGARVVYEPMEGGISGMLYRDAKQVIIGVNSHHAVTRQRFTIAHEIGHLELHKGRPMIVDHVFRANVNFRDPRASRATDAEEIQANQFAAELLMPKQAVVERVARQRRDYPATAEDLLVAELARYFNVSTEALNYRMVNLGLRAPS